MKIHGTAKGGAISHKDFGVAFGSPEPCVPLLWDNSTNAALTAMGNGLKTYRGENFTGGIDVVGKIVNEVKLNLAKYGSGAVAGTVYVVIVKSDFSEIEIGSVAGSAITNQQPTYVEHTFTNNSNTYVMQADDMVCIKYTEGVGSDYLAPQYSSNTYDDSDYAYKDGETWTTNESTLSAPMKIYTDCS